jgi:hypothetical protein
MYHIEFSTERRLDDMMVLRCCFCHQCNLVGTFLWVWLCGVLELCACDAGCWGWCAARRRCCHSSANCVIHCVKGMSLQYFEIIIHHVVVVINWEAMAKTCIVWEVGQDCALVLCWWHSILPNLSNDRIARWRLLLEEYGPTYVHVKGTDNIVFLVTFRRRFWGWNADGKSPICKVPEVWCKSNGNGARILKRRAIPNESKPYWKAPEIG